MGKEHVIQSRSSHMASARDNDVYRGQILPFQPQTVLQTIVAFATCHSPKLNIVTA